jgi:hypothetical protein
MEFDVNDLITKDKKTIESVKSKGAGGRPSLPEEQKKSKKVMSYFTKAEEEALKEIARSQNLSLSNFVRICAVEKIGK